MNFFNKAKTLTLLACSAGVAFAAPTIEIGKWGNFCKGAISHTFDDYPTSSTDQQVASGQKAFDDKGFHMTLFVLAGSVTNWSPLKNAFAKGHEIASHNKAHDVNSSTFKDAQSIIKQNVPGEICATIAYPNCTSNEDAAVKAVYVAGRNCNGSPNKNINNSTNFAQISSQLIGYGNQQYSPKINTASEFNKLAQDAANNDGWSVTCNHGIGSDGHTFSVTNLDEMKKHLDFLDQNRSTIWCETFGNVARYIKERLAATVTVTSSDNNTIKLTLKDNLDDAVYNYPLSLRTELPSGWTDPTVTQGGKAVKDTIVTDGSKKYVMFQAVPDGGDIVLTGDGTPVKEQIRLFETGKMVLIDNNSLSINSHQFSGSNINVSLFNLNGKVIAKYTLNNSEANIALPSKKISNETYFVKVSDGRKTYTEKVTPQL